MEVVEAAARIQIFEGKRLTKFKSPTVSIISRYHSKGQWARVESKLTTQNLFKAVLLDFENLSIESRSYHSQNLGHAE